MNKKATKAVKFDKKLTKNLKSNQKNLDNQIKRAMSNYHKTEKQILDAAKSMY